MATRKASNRFDIITPADNGNFVEYGPAGTTTFVSTMVMQFAPTVAFAGSLQLFGKILGVAGESAPFLPIPYRRVDLAGVASDYALGFAVIADAGIIQVPCSGMTIAFLVTCTAGQMQVYTQDLQGSSAV